jgi:16S rRNA (uracil1498-N3)-methyltransferase
LRRSAAHVFCADLERPGLEPDDAHHLLRVLRLRAGEEVSVSDGTGRWRVCRLRVAHGGQAELEPVGDTAMVPPAAPPVSLAVALPKGEPGDWAVQKLAELGVDRIIVLAAARSTLRWAREGPGQQEKAKSRLRRIIRSAGMQARLVRLPELLGPLSVPELLNQAGLLSVADLDADTGPSLSHPTVLVGPEGGWEPGEVPAHVPRIGLGPTVLRVETAAVVVAGILTTMRG